MTRPSGRAPDQMRPITITRQYTKHAEGSVLVTFGPSGDDMAALKPEALLHRFEDLPEVAERLIA